MIKGNELDVRNIVFIYFQYFLDGGGGVGLVVVTMHKLKWNF